MAFLAWQAWPQQEATESAQDRNDVSIWKTYRTRRYGYEIKYPYDWYVDTTYSESDFTQRGPMEDGEFIGGDTIWSNYQNPNQYTAATIPSDFQAVFLSIYKVNEETPLLDPRENLYIVWKEYINIDGIDGIKVFIQNRENSREVLMIIKLKVRDTIFSFRHARWSVASEKILEKMIKTLKLRK